MKGFCDKKGFPIAIPWLMNFETHVIIQRYNASMTGLMQYYTEWVNNKSTMKRWIYIMRFSCLKTIAGKYRSTISKIFRKFGTDLRDPSDKTIQYSARICIGKQTYEKIWKLHTEKELRIKCLQQGRLQKISEVFLQREDCIIGEYETNTLNPVVTNDDFLERISWVSLRTQSSFDMPCCLCGDPNDVEMHLLVFTLLGLCLLVFTLWLKTKGQRPKGKNPKLRRAFAFFPRSSFSRLELGREALVFNSPSAREHRRLASQREG
jgi:hypothetical protein